MNNIVEKLKKIPTFLRKNSFNDRLNGMAHQERFVPGVWLDHGLSIDYLDSLSFYHEYKDIFQKKIYQTQFEKNEELFIIDAGAYIGLASLFFSTYYPQAKILAFEPDQLIFNVLQKNIRQNNKDGQVELVNKGLASQETTVEFYLDGSDGGSVYHALEGELKKTTIKTTKLSNYITKPVDLLKMNIEGMEAEVLFEIKEKLPLVKQIIFEYHAFSNLPQTLGNILNLLDNAGFRYLINDGTSSKIPMPFEIKDNYKCFNLVYAKNAHFKDL